MSEKMKHCPAPWIIRGQDIVGNDKNGYICTWSGRSADARLIAAAPELLAVAESYKSWMQGSSWRHSEEQTERETWQKTFDRIVDIIAKATGAE